MLHTKNEMLGYYLRLLFVLRDFCQKFLSEIVVLFKPAS